MKPRKTIYQHNFIDISQLKGIKVLYENDFYELAEIVIRLQDACDKTKGNVKSRPTINGLSKIYHHAIGYDYNLDSEDILDIVKKYGFKGGETIDYIKDSAE